MTFSAAQRIAALTAFIVSAHPALGLAADHFGDAHARGMTANTYHGFSIRFQDGRTAFHAREPIAIELVYANKAELSSGAVDGPDSFYHVRLHFDRPVANTLEAIDSKFDDRMSGGVPGCVSYAPAMLLKTINGAYRFDVPGHYRMFAESRQVTESFETSNILEFEILPRDSAWEADVTERARRTLNGSPADGTTASQAFRALRALATNEAAAILAPYLDAGDDVLTSEDVLYGLFADPDRAFVVHTLGRELIRPGRTIGRRFVPDLAYLELLRRHPAGPPFSHDEYLAVMRQLTVRRANALNTVRGRLEEAMRRELADASSEDYFATGLTRAARDFPRQTAAAFQSLTAEAQRGLLWAAGAGLQIRCSFHSFAHSTGSRRRAATRSATSRCGGCTSWRPGKGMRRCARSSGAIGCASRWTRSRSCRIGHFPVSTRDGRGNWTGRRTRPIASRRRVGSRGSGPDGSLRR